MCVQKLVPEITIQPEADAMGGKEDQPQPPPPAPFGWQSQPFPGITEWPDLYLSPASSALDPKCVTGKR